METQRLKIKIGNNEFEAEGAKEVVQAQFEAFKEMVLSAPPLIPSQAKSDDAMRQQPMDTQIPNNGDVTPDNHLDKIMKVEGRVVSLTVAAANIDDAVLLLMYGQKMHRSNDSVTGSEIMDGLKVFGQRVERVDRVLDKAGNEGNIIVLGVKRGKRYRLTNKGLAKAREIARDRLAIVA